MAAIALVVHHGRSDAVVQAVELADWLSENGHEVRVPSGDVDGLDPTLARFATPAERLCDGVELAVSLGGDGSMLRAFQYMADAAVPVLGVNYGELGYLTQVEPEGTHDAIRACLAGDHQIEERMRLTVSVRRADGREEAPGAALNEAVVEKIDSGRTVSVAVSIDDQRFMTYAADGLIAATPTGSTAYSLSARGPIVDPTHEAIVFTPVSPHTLFDRSLVLNAGSVVDFEVLGSRPAALALDGRIVTELAPGDRAVCRAAATPARLIVFGPRDFHRILKAKFGLADR